MVQNQLQGDIPDSVFKMRQLEVLAAGHDLCGTLSCDRQQDLVRSLQQIPKRGFAIAVGVHWI